MIENPKVKQFLTRVSHDVEFRQRLENTQDLGERRRILEAEGFGGVTKEDVEQQLTASGGAELSDAELETVAGGRTASWVSVATAVIALALM